MRKKALLLLVCGFLLLVVTACGSAPTNNSTTTHQNISLTGGTEILLQASCALNRSQCTSNQLAQMGAVSSILEQRIQRGLGISQAVIHLEGKDQIVVDLPPLANKQQAISLLMQIGKLEFLNTGAQSLPVGQVVPTGQYPVVFTGAQLDPNSIDATTDQQSGQPVILFAFKSSSQSAFATYTQQNIGNYLTLALDGKIIESAVIQSAITGQGEISGGNMTLASAQETAVLMRYGALSVPLTVISEQTISG